MEVNNVWILAMELVVGWSLKVSLKHGSKKVGQTISNLILTRKYAKQAGGGLSFLLVF